MILLDLFQSACSRQPFQFVFHQELSVSILYLVYEDSSLFRAALFIIYKVLIVSEEFHISDIVKVVWWDGANLFKFRKVKIEKKRKKCKLYFDQSHLVKYSKTFNISNLFLADLNFIWKPASNFTISLSLSIFSLSMMESVPVLRPSADVSRQLRIIISFGNWRDEHSFLKKIRRKWSIL